MNCDKKTYEKYSDGLSDLIGLSKRKKQKFRLYKCGICGKFHIATLNIKNVSSNVKKRIEKYPVKIWINKPPEKCRIKTMSKKVIVIPFATSKLISKDQADILKRKINETEPATNF